MAGFPLLSVANISNFLEKIIQEEKIAVLQTINRP